MTLFHEGLITPNDIDQLILNDGLIFDKEDQRWDILESMKSIDVQACPGSGKTTLIAAKLILLSKKWPYHDRGVCVLSHTNVAKNEIINRLEKSKTKDARKLLSYPHFIGTIQGFVNKFLALPHLRSNNRAIAFVDDVACEEFYERKIPIGTKNYLDKKYATIASLRLDPVSGEPILPSNPASHTNTYKILNEALKERLGVGYYCFSEMYFFARQCLFENTEISSFLNYRFPFLFLDEMQDTQKYQDDILSSVFRKETTGTIVQRFGDPDQAIFIGSGKEQPNISYNNKRREEMDFDISKSHRFNNELCSSIKHLSFNEVPLEAELTDQSQNDQKRAHNGNGNFKHTIFLYDEDSIQSIIPKFAELVSEQFTSEYKERTEYNKPDGEKLFCVKVVGAVGKKIEKDSDLKIARFWPDYKKDKSSRNFQCDTFIELVRYCRNNDEKDWSKSYKNLFSAYLKIFRDMDKTDSKNKHFNSTTLKQYLKNKELWESLQKLSYHLICDDYPLDFIFWRKVNITFKKILENNDLNKVKAYLRFADEIINTDVISTQLETDLIQLADNKILHKKDNFQIELSTIHGVKGETHDTTLILETKHHVKDFEVMIDFLTGDRPTDELPNCKLNEKPTNSKTPNKQFMRQFYVAASRPRHLLCLAIHKDHIDNDQYAKLREVGWKFDPQHEVAND